MIRSLAISALLCCASLPALSQSAAQLSHTDTNVPPSESFDLALRRDLLAYFRASVAPDVTRVQFRLLREAPTQSGVAYSKYYLWVQSFAGDTLRKEGAVRVAAIDRQRFEVTDFLTKEKVRSDPTAVGSVFPAALVPTIVSLASAKAQ
jgi:hypothetical protein